MSREEIINLYGRNIYQIRLDIAMKFFNAKHTPISAFHEADRFIAYMESLDHERLPKVESTSE